MYIHTFVNMKLEDEIKQAKFKSEKEKAMINLLFTYNWVTTRNSRVAKEFGLSMQQFNVLRILKGQKGNPASVKLIAERMLDKSSNVSRLIDKLYDKKLVDRQFCEHDRRQVDIFITKEGIKHIDEASKVSESEMGKLNLSEKDAKTLNRIFDAMREE